MNFEKYDVETILDEIAQAYVTNAPAEADLGPYEDLKPIQKHQIKHSLLPLLSLFMPIMEKAVIEAAAKSIEAASTMGVSPKDALAIFSEA